MNSRPCPLVDTHFHLDLYASPERVARQIENDEVYTIAVTNAPSVFEHTMALTKNHKYLRPALGLHPELAAERVGELDLLVDLLPKTRYVGEIGLDYTTESQENRRIQRRVFERILSECSAVGGKVLTIHSRRAAGDVVDMLQGFRGTPILHWYSGPKRILKQALSYGCYFSANPSMVRSQNFKALLSWIPKERILAETDGPFVKSNGEPVMPNDTLRVARRIARLWEVSEEEVRKRLFNNFKEVLKTDTRSARGARYESA